ncbi:MAG: chorismate-binding protein, partial [Firmicutes bacterium]|nr:chorismate-binding protein [Bacillota bacterium]
LGYIGFDGRADLNIVIRTIVKVQGTYYFQVGGGITAQSNPEAEYYETLDKARALLRALQYEGSIYHGPYVG